MKALPGKNGSYLWPEPRSPLDKRMGKGVGGARSAIVVLMCILFLGCILVALFMGILEVSTDFGAKAYCRGLGYQQTLQYENGWHCVDMNASGQVTRIVAVPVTALSVQ